MSWIHLITPGILSISFAGVFVGLFVGALPGIGPSVGVGLLLPITYTMSPAASLVFLISIYIAAEYGGSISAIVLSIPGTPSAAAVMLDGYQLTKKGKPGKALAYSLWGTTFGGAFSLIALILISQPLANFSLKFGSAEYFALGLFGVTAVAMMGSKNIILGLISGIFGMWLSTVGVDISTNVERFTFGFTSIMNGIPMLPLLIGLFAISEAIRLMTSKDKKPSFNRLSFRVWLEWAESIAILPYLILGSVVGLIVGMFPGVGAGPGAWLSYNYAKIFSKRSKEFGQGVPEGISTPEASNGAVVSGSLIPALALGVPGSPTSAIILGALVMHGLVPGPQLFSNSSSLVKLIFIGLASAIIFIFILGLTTNQFWARVVGISPKIMGPIILILSMIGAYAGRESLFDVGLAVGFGVFGYFLEEIGGSSASLIIGFILGGMIETNLRRMLIISHGSLMPLLTHPIALVLLILALLMTIYSTIKNIKEAKFRRSTHYGEAVKQG